MGKRIMITDGEQVRIYKETVIVCEKVVARNSPGHSKKNCDHPAENQMAKLSTTSLHKDSRPGKMMRCDVGI